MGLVRAETVDLYRGGLPINPLPARKGKTFDRTWHIARWKEGLRNPDKDRSNVCNYAYEVFRCQLIKEIWYN